MYKIFKIRNKNITRTTLPLVNMTDEYPARWWIIIINPNSKKLKYLWKFLKIFIKLWKTNKLPFYENLLSPFVWQKILNKKLYFLNQDLWKFIFLENFWVKYKDNITPNIINYFKWDLDINKLIWN